MHLFQCPPFCRADCIPLRGIEPVNAAVKAQATFGSVSLELSLLLSLSLSYAQPDSQHCRLCNIVQL